MADRYPSTVGDRHGCPWAAFLCADLGITDEPRADHAQYLASWLTAMKDDKKAIFTAASKASEAAAFLTALQGT
jgi:antirestriction protein ArdC